MEKTGILLDVDGTLWNAVKNITVSWNEYRKREIPEIPAPFTTRDIEGVLGKTMDEIRDILLAPVARDRLDFVMNGLMQYEVDYLYTHGGEVYPKVPETLRTLKKEGYHLYIVSNCQKGYIEDFLHFSGTEDLIEDHVCFGDTGKTKDVSMRVCIERNDISQAVYVGDTEGDLVASGKAGIPFIYASYGFGSLDPGREHVPYVHSFSRLPETLRILRNAEKEN